MKVTKGDLFRVAFLFDNFSITFAKKGVTDSHIYGIFAAYMAAKSKKILQKEMAISPNKQRVSIATSLSDKEERFCYEYVLHLNATKAAINAGYSERSARVTACRLLTKANIQNRVNQLKENLADTAEISALKIINEHSKIAFSSIAHLHQTWIERVDFDKLTDDQKASIKSISTKVLKKNIGTSDEPEIADVEFVKVELFDKQKSLDSITQMLGYNAPTKHELMGKDGKDLFAKMTDDELDDKIKELEDKLRR